MAHHTAVRKHIKTSTFLCLSILSRKSRTHVRTYIRIHIPVHNPCMCVQNNCVLMWNSATNVHQVHIITKRVMIATCRAVWDCRCTCQVGWHSSCPVHQMSLSHSTESPTLQLQPRQTYRTPNKTELYTVYRVQFCIVYTFTLCCYYMMVDGYMNIKMVSFSVSCIFKIT